MAFYFQKDSLLLPEMAGNAETEWELSLEYRGFFPASEVFTVPELSGNGSISFLSVPPEAPLPPGWQAIPVRQAFSLIQNGAKDGAGQADRILRAFHIAQWRKESQFCGSCGSKNSDSAVELARICPACGRTEFPRIAPAVITLILNNEGKALLAHNKKFVSGIYSLIAGFAEAGESLEAAVARETHEEVGIDICDIRYVVSQSWPFPNSLMLGFTARYAGGAIHPDGVEIEDARWFGREELPRLPGPGSVARYLIERWLEGDI